MLLLQSIFSVFFMMTSGLYMYILPSFSRTTYIPMSCLYNTYVIVKYRVLMKKLTLNFVPFILLKQCFLFCFGFMHKFHNVSSQLTYRKRGPCAEAGRSPTPCGPVTGTCSCVGTARIEMSLLPADRLRQRLIAPL